MLNQDHAGRRAFPAPELADPNTSVRVPTWGVLAGYVAEGTWLCVALGLALLFALRTMAPALEEGDVVADDMRQYLVWLDHLTNPSLFQNDPIAAYYGSVSPLGYSAVYWAASWLAEPIQTSRYLPVVLGMLAAAFTYLFVRRLYPSPLAAFLATVLASWYLWQYEDVASATPRAFMTPLLAAELWALATRRVALAVATLAIAALLYPFAAVLGLALVAVWSLSLDSGRPRIAVNPAHRVLLGGGGLLVIGLLLVGQARASEFGPAFSASQARAMPEFGAEGRIPIFPDDAVRFWVTGRDTGFDTDTTDQLTGLPLLFEYAFLAITLLAFLRFGRRVRSPRLFSPEATLLPRLLVASVGLFLLAHALLLHLYFPSRYVRSSVPLLLAIVAGLALAVLVEHLALRTIPRRVGLASVASAIALAVLVMQYPADHEGQLREDPNPRVTAYLRAQPPGTLVAGASLDVDSVPAFAQRPVLTSREHALPFHSVFYTAQRARIEALIDTYYSANPAEVAAFMTRHHVDVLLVNRAAFRDQHWKLIWSGYSSEGRWEPFIGRIAKRLEEGDEFALVHLADRCSVLRDGTVDVVPASCVEQATRAFVQ
jgi:hypothetical protein